MPVLRGRQFLHTPGPTNIPDRVLRAMDRPPVDFMSPDFRAVAAECFEGLKQIFRTRDHVLMYAANGHGAWESALVNVCSAGDRVLLPETGAFSVFWRAMFEAFGVEVEELAQDWREGVDPAAVEERLREDKAHRIKVVALVHNETSTGVINDCAAIRRAMDAAGHPALLMVDTISSLGSMDFRMDDWGVDVAVGGSQKGLMLPPGLGFTGVSARARKAAETATLPKNYWDWRRITPGNGNVGFYGTAPTNMVFGLHAALELLLQDGLDAVLARHHRLAGAVRAAVRAWGGNGGGPELFARHPERQSDSVTAILLPEGQDADALRAAVLARYNVSLGGGLERLQGRVFRIGHLGDLNEPMVLGALGAVETAMAVEGVPHRAGGVQAAIVHFAEADRGASGLEAAAE